MTLICAMKNWINLLKSKLLMKLLGELCDKNEDCTECKALLYTADVRHHCAQSYVIEQALQKWCGKELNENGEEIT